MRKNLVSDRRNGTYHWPRSWLQHTFLMPAFTRMCARNMADHLDFTLSKWTPWEMVPKRPLHLKPCYSKVLNEDVDVCHGGVLKVWPTWMQMEPLSDFAVYSLSTVHDRPALGTVLCLWHTWSDLFLTVILQISLLAFIVCLRRLLPQEVK